MDINDYKQKKDSSAIYTLLKVLYCFIWIFIGGYTFLYLAFSSDLYDAIFSKNASLFIFILSIFCLLTPIFLKSMKRRWLRYLITYCIVGTFFISFFTITTVAENYFSDFTTEKWFKYPKLRNYMVDDLIENHNIIGMNENEVIELLGTPDTRNDTIFAYYMDEKYKDAVYIEITFADGKVIYIDYVYQL